MWLYLLKRLSFMLPMLLGITLVSFTVIHLAPEDFPLQKKLPVHKKETRKRSITDFL